MLRISSNFYYSLNEKIEKIVITLNTNHTFDTRQVDEDLRHNSRFTPVNLTFLNELT